MVQPGRIYRSGQMPPDNLTRAVRDHQVKTVLNLRGANPKVGWYNAERAATLKAGATQIDLSMASDMWLSRNQARTVLDVLDTCTYPILIHCQWGAERTGLVSAMAELIRPGGSLAAARRQFSLYYMYVKAGDGAVMEYHLDRYEQWLQARKRAHSPAQFRHWIATEFRPESPSREEWPYDPYPPIVITRPSSPPPPSARLADDAKAVERY